ncbi:hypothetical protein I552_6554 [Mycobacterium xenopi 3993]|nr:hypothetical protein I552_6554 [Mycobacterium xenopi 3993]
MIPSNRGLSKYRCTAATSCSNGVRASASASMVVAMGFTLLSSAVSRRCESILHRIGHRLR